MLSARGASILNLSFMFESGNVKYKPELLLFTEHCKVLSLSCLLVELVELSSRNLIVIVQQTNRGRLRRHMSQPICYHENSTQLKQDCNK